MTGPDRNVYLSGEIIPAAEASIDIADPAFLHGSAVFTTMLASRGTVFRFDRHLKRLSDNVNVLGLDVEVTTGQLVSGMYAVIDANGLSEARCRITLTPGPPDRKPVTLMTADPLPDYPAAWHRDGIAVVVTSLKQFSGDPMAGRKTACYLPRILARREAAAKGSEEALWFTTDNHLAEACFSNVFLVLNGTVRTPPKDTPVLPGVTREAVLELCAERDIPADEEGRLTVDDMLDAEEVFLTSATMGIRPVIRIEKHRVGTGTPGDITRVLTDAYRELVARECDRGRDGNNTASDEEGA